MSVTFEVKEIGESLILAGPEAMRMIDEAAKLVRTKYPDEDLPLEEWTECFAFNIQCIHEDVECGLPLPTTLEGWIERVAVEYCLNLKAARTGEPRPINAPWSAV